MDLKNAELNVAVNALIGSMVKNGYINELKNSILITVDSSDAGKGKALQERLAAEVDELLSGFSVEGAVLSQPAPKDDAIAALAVQYGISDGKAALVNQLVNQDDTLRYEDIAALPINDINLLLQAKHTELQGVTASGEASKGAYIGEDRAKELALGHARVSASAASRWEVELDYDDGRMIYELEFYADGVEYEYEIDAIEGTIHKHEQEQKRIPAQADAGAQPGSSTPKPASTPAAGGTQSGTYIGREKAKEIALGHANAPAADIRELDIDLDQKKGRMVYEVEFVYSGLEFEYRIDAVTGELIWWGSEKD